MICTLCGAPIKEGDPHESWMWPSSGGAERTLRAHPGCRRLQQQCLDIGEWPEGALADLLRDWLSEQSGDAEELAWSAAGDCEHAQAVVRGCCIIRLRGDGDAWTIDQDSGCRCWDTAEEAMDEVPGAWWSDEPGCWLCHGDELKVFLSDRFPGPPGPDDQEATAGVGQ